MTPAVDVDLPVDLDTIDDTDLPWAFLDGAADPAGIQVGRFVVVGSGTGRAVAQVLDIEAGIVHVRPLAGAVASHAHLLEVGRHAY
ncbi:MAG TPA: hypothetical protein VFN21_07255 [Acidimicrobiales bacterium]|nr:hypothetical protein [Acidimicrobiales bacterium]